MPNWVYCLCQIDPNCHYDSAKQLASYRGFRCCFRFHTSTGWALRWSSLSCWRVRRPSTRTLDSATATPKRWSFERSRRWQMKASPGSWSRHNCDLGGWMLESFSGILFLEREWWFYGFWDWSEVLLRCLQRPKGSWQRCWPRTLGSGPPPSPCWRIPTSAKREQVYATHRHLNGRLMGVSKSPTQGTSRIGLKMFKMCWMISLLHIVAMVVVLPSESSEQVCIGSVVAHVENGVELWELDDIEAGLWSRPWTPAKKISWS